MQTALSVHAEGIFGVPVNVWGLFVHPGQRQLVYFLPVFDIFAKTTTYPMKTIPITTLLLLLLSSCTNNPEWIKTRQGCFFYDVPMKNCSYSWSGGVVGPLANGKGVLTVYSENGKILSEDKAVMELGTTSSWSYLENDKGRYLGPEDKENRPHGFGVEILKDNTLKITSFKHGKELAGLSYIYSYDPKKPQNSIPQYVGNLKKGKRHGQGKEYKDGEIVYEGNFVKDKYDGVGALYDGQEVEYEGFFKNGERHGVGKQYAIVDGSSVLLYNGEWKSDKYDGEGTLYEGGRVKYTGSWKDGLYDGYGKLYDEGKCTEGKWIEGKASQKMSSTILKQITRTKDLYTGNQVEVEQESYTDLQLASDQQEFITLFQEELNQKISDEISRRIKKRFNFWNICRMITQSWLRPDVIRAKKAEKFFCKNLKTEDLENEINAKIAYFNSTSSSKLNLVHLEDPAFLSIVDANAAAKIFDRESMESADVAIDVLVTILVCLIVAFIIGFIIGLFIPALVPYAGIVDIVLAIVAFVISFVISVKYGGPVITDLENSIKQIICDNYQLYFDMQNLIGQIIG